MISKRGGDQMYTYAIGDIHGCYNKFLNMLDAINFQEDDEIICVGDYIDRGMQSFEMLKWIEDYPYNFMLIQGNHEAEFIVNIEILKKFANKIGINDNDINDSKLLYQTICKIPQIQNAYFDNYRTIYELIFNHDMPLSQLVIWADIMSKMPFMYVKRINNIKHIIIHAGYNDDNNINTYIYGRCESYSKDTIIVAGHTPTIFYDEFAYNNGNVYKSYNKKLNSMYINVDCGCAYNNQYHNAKLACIRLEDMKEYYV